MGSSYDLRMAGYSVLSDKRIVPDEILGMFVESDRRKCRPAPDFPAHAGSLHAEEDDEFVGYVITAAELADRLDVLGFTVEVAREEYEFIRNEVIAEGAARVATLHEDFALIQAISFETWVATMTTLMADGVRWKDYDQEPPRYPRELTLAEGYILASDWERPPWGFYCYDLRFLLRALLLCCPGASSVVLDVTDLVGAGYFEEEARLALEAREHTASIARSFEKIIVLTEGSSDARLLRQALRATYPHLCEFFSFLDHSAFSVPGGASQLGGFVKAFAGAGIANRIVAVFDNDTAGSLELSRLRTLRLPENFRLLQLPYLESAEAYPTIGPTGDTEMNINGLACSIELYLGTNALIDDKGKRVPIQWTGLERTLGKYQGEVLDKQRVQERFLSKLKDGTAELRDISAVIETIIRAFSK